MHYFALALCIVLHHLFPNLEFGLDGVRLTRLQDLDTTSYPEIAFYPESWHCAGESDMLHLLSWAVLKSKLTGHPTFSAAASTIPYDMGRTSYPELRAHESTDVVHCAVLG